MIREAQYITKKFFNENRNDSDFTANTGEFSSNFNYNLLQKGLFEGQVITYAYENVDDSFYKQSPSKSIYGALADMSGFGTSDSIRIVPFYDGSTVESADQATLDALLVLDWTGTVDSVSANTMYFTSATTLTSDQERVLNAHCDLNIFLTTQYNYIEYDYNFIENDDTVNYESVLDLQILRYSGDITSSYTSLTHSVKNFNTGSLEIKEDGYTQAPIQQASTWNVAQLFSIKHNFILDHYVESNIINYTDDTPIDQFISDNCLDYLTNLKLYTSKGKEQGKQSFEVRHVGNTGFLNENFNNALKPYEVSDVVVKKLSDSTVIDNVSTQFPCLVECTLTGDFSSANNFVFYHKTLKQATEYAFADTLYSNLFNYESVKITSLGVPASDTIIQNATVTAVDASSVSLSYEVHAPSYDGAYVTGIHVEKDSFDSVSSDMTNVVISSADYQNTFDTDGLMDVTEFNVIPSHCNPLTETGGTKMATVGDDLFFIKTEFTLSLADSAVLEDFEVRSVIYNSTTDDLRILDTQNISLANMVTVSGVQQINDSFASGYTSINPNARNATFKYLSDDGTDATYELILPYRVPSQKHIASVSDLSSVGFFNTNADDLNGSNVEMYGKNANGYTQHIGLYFKVSGSEYTFLSPDLDVKNYQEEFNSELFQSEDIQPSVDGVDVSVIVNNKDNKITTTVESVSDLTGTTLINQVYLQPSTGNKYSAFDISSTLLSTDGFTHIYEGTLPADTITSNHCITSIVSTDTCDTSVFDGLLSNAILIHSKDQELLGANKYIDKNGVVNSPVDIFKIYNQLQEGTSDLTTQQPDDDLNLVNNAFEYNDLTSVVRSFLRSAINATTTEITSMVDIQSVQSNNIFLTWTFLGGGFFRFSKNISGGVDLYDTSIGNVATSIFDISSAKNITVTVASNNDVDIYVDAVLTYSYNRTGSYLPFNGFLIGANNSRNEIVFSKHFAWDTVLTQSQIASIINEKY